VRANGWAVQGDAYKNDQYVYVRGESTPAGALEKDKDFWVARILEVRAKNAQHVYALVCFLLAIGRSSANGLGDVDVLV